jgi:hypothetical protein
MDQKDLKDFLDVKVKQYNNKKFIESDPIQIPHQLLKYGASKKRYRNHKFFSSYNFLGKQKKYHN